jgi:hypothetical protein
MSVLEKRRKRRSLMENVKQISLFPEVDNNAITDFFGTILLKRYNEQFISQMMKPSIFQQYLPGGKYGGPKVPKVRVQVPTGTRKRKTRKKLRNVPKRRRG